MPSLATGTWSGMVSCSLQVQTLGGREQNKDEHILVRRPPPTPDTPTRTMPSRLPVMMAWLASHAGPSTMQQQVMAPSGPQAVVMLARGCPLTFHRDRWAPAQETMVPCAGRPGFTPSGVTACPPASCSATCSGSQSVYQAPSTRHLLKTTQVPQDLLRHPLLPADLGLPCVLAQL